MSVLFQCFITLEKSNTFLSKAYLCKSHENVNFKLKLIKRLKKLIIKIPASVLLLLIKKCMKICHGREKTEREIFIPLDDNTSSGLRFDLTVGVKLLPPTKKGHFPFQPSFYIHLIRKARKHTKIDQCPDLPRVGCCIQTALHGLRYLIGSGHF